MEDPEPMVREPLISEIKSAVRLQEGHPAAEPCWRSEPSSRVREELHTLAEEHQQADDEA
jgi:hypothetical protein